MDRWVDRVAVVTGASSGIGNSVAKALVTLGMKVVGCSRTIEPIQVCEFFECSVVRYFFFLQIAPFN